MYETMSRDDLIQSLGIVLANEPASMDAYNIFRNLNQTSKSTRAVVKYALQDESWTRKYFERAHAFEKTIEDSISVETLDGIVRDLSEFQPVLSVQIRGFEAMAAFIRGRPPRLYEILDELMSKNIARHTSPGALDLHVAYCTILKYDSRKIHMGCYSESILKSNVDGLVDLMVLHRKKPGVRLQISVCEMLSTQGIYTHSVFSYREYMVKFLLDQIANTHGIKALTSIKLLHEACKDGLFSDIRHEIVSNNGIAVVLKYIRKDFACKDSWRQKEENQQVGFQIIVHLTLDLQNVVRIIEDIFNTTIIANNALFDFMSDNQKDRLHLAELQNNIHAYWMMADLIHHTMYELPRFSEHYIGNVIQRIERDSESTQALLYLSGILFCLLSKDEENVYAGDF